MNSKSLLPVGCCISLFNALPLTLRIITIVASLPSCFLLPSFLPYLGVGGDEYATPPLGCLWHDYTPALSFLLHLCLPGSLYP